ncbi:MAG: gliding motility-associated C-terminal domain-containing protein [Flavisolibacter sp.]|nr:gliding motility-associated C-terminal domain-containing protein [Flavisolibacter sp.]
MAKSLPLSASQEICDNNLDDDNNGLTDGNDFACYFNSGSGCDKSTIVWGCTSAGDLIWVDIETGIEHLVGRTDHYMSDLTWAANGKLYGVAGIIWEIDPNTAAIRPLPPIPDGYLGGNAMTADGLGNLYLSAVMPSSNRSYIIRLNIETWKVCTIADITAANIFSAGDLSFLNGNLYLASGSMEGNKIAKIDVQTGRIDPITVVNPSTGGYYGLINGGDNYFYASDNDKIFRIDPNTMTAEPSPVYTFTHPYTYLNGLASYSETCNGAKCTAWAKIYSSSLPPYCKNIQLNLQADTSCNIGLGTYTWTLPGGAITHDSKLTTSNEGMYYLKYQTSPTCMAEDSFFVQYQPVPEVSLGRDTSLCETETLTLQVPMTGSYLWQDGSNKNSFRVDKAGLYWVKFTANGCSVSDSVHIAYNPLPLINLGSDTVICSDQTVLLNATGSGIVSYRWQDASNQSTYLATGEGKFSVTVTDNNGCIAKDSVVVSTKPLPTFTLGNDTTLCEQESLPLSLSLINASYQWSAGNTSSSYTITKAGLYWVDVSQNGCVKRDSIFVGYSPLPRIKLGRDTTLCEGSSLLLDASYTNASYQWQDKTISSSLLVTKPGLYYVSVNADGCIASDSIRIFYKSKPKFSLGRDTTWCNESEVVLSPMVNNANYLWQDGSTAHSYIVRDSGRYSVTIWNECGSMSDDIYFRKGICSLHLPNAFTPNYDGLNDLFRVKDASFIKVFRMNIYNRWGKLVFTTSDPYKGWNGMYQNMSQPAGTYIWQINLTTKDGEKLSRAGSVVLIR